MSIGVNTRSNTIPIRMRLEIVEMKTGYGVKKQESFHANMNTLMDSHGCVDTPASTQVAVRSVSRGSNVARRVSLGMVIERS